MAMEDKEQRRETREQLIGDVCWAYASVSDEHKGILIEESKSGMSIMTYSPVKEGSILRIDCKGSIAGTRYVTVKWCKEVAPNNYRCGLSVIKHY
jgi:hypothetical protein